MQIEDVYSENELKSFSPEERKKILAYYEEAKKQEEKLKEAYLKDPFSLDSILYSLRKEYNNNVGTHLAQSDPKQIAILKVKDERAAESFRSLWNDIMKSGGIAYYENGKLVSNN